MRADECDSETAPANAIAAATSSATESPWAMRRGPPGSDIVGAMIAPMEREDADRADDLAGRFEAAGANPSLVDRHAAQTCRGRRRHDNGHSDAAEEHAGNSDQ